jgi:DNA-binding transcriptional MerR regulator
MYGETTLDFARKRWLAATVVACLATVSMGRAPLSRVVCVQVAEYRLDDLAKVSGVSARNIRAYRERGLLDPPRRVGRSAYYDDYHLSQLKTINQLLRKGFNSAHIAEFFESMRHGADLADILGIQRAVLGPQGDQDSDVSEPPGGESSSSAGGPFVTIDPRSDEARRLVDYGLAELVDGAVVLVDRSMADIVMSTSDHRRYVRTILRIFEATRAPIEKLRAEFVAVLEECVTDLFDASDIPGPDEADGPSHIAQDYRDLGSRIMAVRLDAAARQMVATPARAKSRDQV